MIPGTDIMADIQEGHRVLRLHSAPIGGLKTDEAYKLASIHAQLAIASSLFNIANLLWETNEKLEKLEQVVRSS